MKHKTASSKLPPTAHTHTSKQSYTYAVQVIVAIAWLTIRHSDSVGLDARDSQVRILLLLFAGGYLVRLENTARTCRFVIPCGLCDIRVQCARVSKPV